MLFQKCVLEDLFSIVEKQHQMEFWQAFCYCVDSDQLHPMASGASEYEIYFNFVFARTNQVEIRPLKRFDVPTLDWLGICKKHDVDYFSCHDWMRAYGPPREKDLR